jgi:hypothetical protein
MEDRLLSVNNLEFSSLFGVKSAKANDLFKNALNIFKLEEEMSFASVEDNYEKLRTEEIWIKKELKGPEDSIIVNVPGKGDCWLIALLAPLLGYVEERQDVIRRVRKTLSSLVMAEPNRFRRIFQTMKDLKIWCEKVKRPKEWEGTDAFEVFTEATGIAVHVINMDRPEIERLQHHLPKWSRGRSLDDMKEDWEASIVLTYGESHYMAVAPKNISDSVAVSRGISTKHEALVTINIDDEWKPAKDRKKTKFPKKITQKGMKQKRKQLFQSSGSSDVDNPKEEEEETSNVKPPTYSPGKYKREEVMSKDEDSERVKTVNENVSKDEYFKCGKNVNEDVKKNVKQSSLFSFFKKVKEAKNLEDESEKVTDEFEKVSDNDNNMEKEDSIEDVKVKNRDDKVKRKNEFKSDEQQNKKVKLDDNEGFKKWNEW